MLGGKWISDNWHELQGYAKQRHKDEWGELMVHFAFWLDKNWSLFNAMPQIDRIKFSRTWFKNNATWSKSDFRKSINVNNLPDDFQSLFADEEYDAYIEINAEEVGDDVKEWMIDIHRNWSDRDAKRIIKIREIYLGLPLHQKVLYDMYFTNMMSMRDIGKKLNLPHMAIYTMINDLKKIIQSKCNGI